MRVLRSRMSCVLCWFAGLVRSKPASRVRQLLFGENWEDASGFATDTYVDVRLVLSVGCRLASLLLCGAAKPDFAATTTTAAWLWCGFLSRFQSPATGQFVSAAQEATTGEDARTDAGAHQQNNGI